MELFFVETLVNFLLLQYTQYCSWLIPVIKANGIRKLIPNYYCTTPYPMVSQKAGWYEQHIMIIIYLLLLTIEIASHMSQ